MTPIITLPNTLWDQPCSVVDQENALHSLEQGNVLFFPQLSFSLEKDESQFLSPAIAAKSKNVSLDCSRGILKGSSADEAKQHLLQSMMQRFATSTVALLHNLLPHYTAGLVQGRTSFRPVEIAQRAASWRKDDTRLHVDSFPSSPVQGKRILRVFSNVNPQGKSRSWRLGEPFENVARRYLPALSHPVWGSSRLLKLTRITKSRRSAYDHFMLQLHDHMKADMDYQSQVDQVAFDFPAGSTWMTFTDQASHAAMTGQHAFEQTFYLPVACMQNQSLSPLRVLERLANRALI